MKKIIIFILIIILFTSCSLIRTPNIMYSVYGTGYHRVFYTSPDNKLLSLIIELPSSITYMTNDIEANNYLIYDPWGNKPYLNFGYGGLELEYIIQSDNLVHFSVCTLIGAGGVSYRNSLWNNNEDGWNNWNSPGDAFFVFEPAANVELNIISFFRINAGISYRLISGVNFDNLKNSDLGGLSGLFVTS